MAGTNLGQAYVQIMPSTKGIAGSISNVLSGESTSAGKAAGMNIVGALKGVIAAAGIGAFFKKALDFGGELQQNLGGTEAVFGQYAKNVQSMAEDAYKNMGMSASDYMATANKMGSLFQGSGLTQQRSLDLTTKAMQRAADVASVMGISQQSAMESIAGAAKGNFTMMDNLGVAMNATTLAAYALEKGVNFDWNTASNAEKAELAMQMFMERTAQYEGNFARESEETFSGSIESMKAAATNLMANLSLGRDIREPLYALFNTTKNFLVNNLLPMVGNIIKQLPGVIGTGIKELFSNLPGVVEALKNWFNELPNKIKDGTGTFLSSMKELFLSIWDGIKNTDWIGLATSIFNALKEGITAAAPQIGDALRNIGGSIKEWFLSVDWPEVGHTVLNLIGDGIGIAASFLWERIKEIAHTAVEWWDGIDWSEAGKNAFHKLVEGLKTIGSFLWETLKAIGSRAAEHFQNSDVDWKEVGIKVLKMIGQGLLAIGSFIWEALKTIGQAAAEKFQEIDWLQLGKDVIKFIWEGLGAIGSWIWEKLKLLGDAAVDKFKNIDWLQLGKDVIQFIWNGLTEIGSWIWEKLQGLGNEAVDKFKEIDWLQLGKDCINSIVDGLTDIGHTIWETIKGFGDSGKSEFDGIDWYNTGYNAGNEIANGMYGSANGVQNAANYIAATMQNAINGQISGIGINVVQGLTVGMTSQQTQRPIAQASASVAGRTTKSLRKSFSIGSPSKLMRDEIGQWIPAGIAEGIEDNASMVTDAMKNIASDTVGAFDTDFAYNGTVDTLEGSAPAASDTITMNIYPSAGMNERQLADMVQQRLALAQRQKQAAWGTA